jgi:hypothetical protein
MENAGMDTGAMDTGSPVDAGIDVAETTEATEGKPVKTYKVNGKEKNIDIDTLLKERQKYEAADERFREAAEIRKKYGKYEEFEKALQNKDLSILSKYVDPDTIRQFSEKQLLEWMEYQGLSDTEKELLEHKKKLKDYEEREAEKKAEQERLQREQVNSQAMQIIDEEIVSTFKEIGEKPTPAKIIRMAMHMSAALDNKQHITGKEAYRRATIDLKNDLSGYLESVDENELMNVLPKKAIDAIRKRSVEEVTQAPFARNKQQDIPIKKTNGKIVASTDDYFKMLDQKFQRR